MPPKGREIFSQEFDQIAALVKQESLYSEDSVPTSAEAVFYTGTPTVAMVGNNVERNIAKPYWGNDPHDTTAKFVTVTGDVEVTGAGTAGDVPGAAALLRACGFAETQNAGTSVVYTPASLDIPSVSTYFYHDNDLWMLCGGRGTVKLTMNAGQFALWNFATTHLFSLPEDAPTLPTLPPVSDAEPQVLSYNNTPTSNIAGVDIDIQGFEFDCGNSLVNIDRPGQYSVQIKDRAPTGTLTTSAQRLTALNVWELANDNQTVPINVQHGVDDGRILEVSMPRVQLDLTGIQASDLGENEKGLQIPYKALPVNGDDEVSFTFR